MSLGPKKKKIDGANFSLQLLGTDEALDLLTRVGRIVSPALLEKGHGAGQSEKEWTVMAVGRLLKEFDSEELKSLIALMLSGCTMDGAPLFDSNGGKVAYNQAFSGRLSLLAKVLAWALIENLGDFSGPLEMLTRKAAEKLGVSVSKTPSNDTQDGSTSKDTSPSTAS